jgi:pimeloyl-ACP methyl ester carboxylesterase
VTTTGTQGAYATVNGLRMYYEVHGSGRPLILLHGGMLTIDLSFGLVLPALTNSTRPSASNCRATDTPRTSTGRRGWTSWRTTWSR